ncbi:amino acid adenylation domain-containing protein [Haliangium sp.]|uniref:amino acid adenylation domain-containing protein n=1 Tax=Haliangium sp. TaxID=2663208 RepID=UPI003D0F4EC3
MPAATVIERFLAQAAAQPEAEAILVDGRLGYRYGELARAALGIGASLVARGVGRDELVGIAADKSPALIAAMLGTWAAGAAFAVLDPAQPVARRGLQIDDGKMRWILCGAGQTDADAGAGRAGVKTVSIAEAAAAAPLAAPVPARPQDLAYACWTSGSTGRPKGVAVEHRGLASMLAQQIDWFELGPGARSLFVLDIGFDAALSDIFTALGSGACLCIESALAQGPPTPAALFALMRARAVTYADLPPALLALLDPAQAPPSLATVVIGGEVCAAEVVRAWSRRVRLLVVYGPTEATVCTSVARCGPDWDRPLLGQPLAGVRYRVVDEAGAELPAGVAGQLAIAGAQVARGYIARSALDAERFATVAGERCFLTGDRVVRDPDGQWRFLGRVDRQVKIRGRLVAPEEVEAALMAHPEVAAAYVSTRAAGARGRSVLVAAVEPRPGRAPTRAELARHLAARVPGWMIPQRIDVVPRLPRTTSGKIDGAAVAAWDRPTANAEAGADAEAGAGSSTPSSAVPLAPAEQVVAAAARAVLGHLVEDGPAGAGLDLTRGFMALGGDSLSVLEMAAACELAGLSVDAAALAADVPLQALAAGAVDARALSPQALDAHAARVAERMFAGATRSSSGIEAGIGAPGGAGAGSRPAGGTLLVTGATGFLGARVVLALAERTRAPLRCLVRADSVEHARVRLAAACDRHRPGSFAAVGARIEVVPGDLSRPCLGLSDAAYQRLADSVEAVIHCAAAVNLVAPLSALAPHNLDGTAAVARLCLDGAATALHAVSTLSVFVATDRAPGPVGEDDDIGAATAVYGGYAQSKWAAERVLARVPGAELAIAHYRPGLITGDPERGALPARDFLTMFTRGLAAVGAVPEAWLDRLAFDVTPVSYAAEAIAALSLSPVRAGAVYHLAGREPVPLRGWIEAMRACGVALDLVDEDRFRDRLLAGAEGLGVGAAPGSPGSLESGRALGRAAVLLGLCRGLAGPGRARHRGLDLFQATGMRFDADRAEAALAPLGLTRPRATPALLARYAARVLSLPAPRPDAEAGA